jgi:TusA-related sulfurtransferase
MSTITVDTRGLSCPQPVVETVRAARQHPSDTLEVLADTATSRENIARFARNNHWTVDISETTDGEFKLTLKK